LIPPTLLGTPLHPTQLYEAFGNMALAALLHFHFLRGVRAGRYREGTAFLAYAGLYSLLRFLVEFARGDDRGFYAWGLSVSQWVGLGLLVVVGLLFLRRRHDPTRPL
jgi:phosphatidylglycerol:prolipoprotein diacylglycerol transferase